LVFVSFLEPGRDGELVSSKQTGLKARRESFLDRHPFADEWQNFFFSATTYSLWKASKPLMTKYCRGRVLDAGSGRGGWSRVIVETADLRESVDLAPRGGECPTWKADLTDMPEIPSDRYDTVVCHQVLEHVRRPAAAVQEMRRVLMPGGHLIASVPHLSRRHELPHDYQRFTQEGFRELFSSQGLEVVTVVPYGGVLSFLHHQVSSLAILPFTDTALMPMLVALNTPASMAFVWLDRVTDHAALAPTGVIAVARKG
jgi:SAM-dependent methyltransferase